MQGQVESRVEKELREFYEQAAETGQKLYTWQNCPWDTIPNAQEHYDPAKGERSYGIIAVTKAMKALVITSRSSKGIKMQFPKGHAEGLQSPWEAARKECYEEAGVTVDEKTPILGQVQISYPMTYPEDVLNMHINRQLMKGETVTFFVVMIDEQPTRAETGTVVETAEWRPLEEVIKIMSADKSYHLSALEQALPLLRNAFDVNGN